ncbi:tektin [Caerostris extrusa]|uniref:Tektin n=1 Tax=Caerostris extrusa TaxID=172846 RepID=A0AAV4QLI6_CAEEX|nr:tektin [Caerostris extrusa]
MSCLDLNSFTTGIAGISHVQLIQTIIMSGKVLHYTYVIQQLRHFIKINPMIRMLPHGQLAIALAFGTTGFRFDLKPLKIYGLACAPRSLRSSPTVLADADSCCSAGVPFQDKLLADAANAHQRGRHTKLWCETTTKTAESNIRDAYGARDAKLRQWKEHLNKEVDKLALEIARVESFQREVVRRRQYLSDVIRASDMTSSFRNSLPDKGEDHIGLMQKEEMNVALTGDSNLQQCYRDLKECERRRTKYFLRNKKQNFNIRIRIYTIPTQVGEKFDKCKWLAKSIMSEVEAKAFNLNLSRRSQNAEPPAQLPLQTEDHPVDQIYHPNTEEDWEKDLEDKMQKSVAIRQGVSTCILRTQSIIKDELTKTADAWYRTSKALQEAVQKDERALFNVHNLLKTVRDAFFSACEMIPSYRLKICPLVCDHQLSIPPEVINSYRKIKIINMNTVYNN